MAEYLSGGRIQGSSTADKTPDYTSDFTSVGSDGDGVGWISSDTSKFYVDASEDKYFFNTNASSKSSYFDLDNATNAPNVGTLTTSYVVRWKMKFNAVTSSAIYWEIGLSDGTGERNANQHFNGIHMREDHFRISVTKDNQAPDGASGTYLSAVSPTETFNTTDTIYFELIRDGVDFTLNRYTADDYSTGKTTPCTLTINNSTWVGAPAAIMRYFRIITNNSATQSGHVWDVKFYNDVTSALSDEKATITNVPVGTRYEETDTRKIYRKVTKTDSFTDSFTSSSAWSQTGNKWSVDASTDNRVENVGYSSYTPNDYVYHDMGASFHACDQSFNLRYKILAVGAGGYIQVGFTDNTTDGNSGDSLNAGLNTYNTAYGYTRIYDTVNGTFHEVETASSVTPSGMYNTAIWMEFAFNSTTNVATVKCFSDSGFTTPLNASTQNLSHTLTMSDYQGLRYLFIGSIDASGRTLDSGSYVDDITLYTGISDVDDAVTVEWQEKGTA